MTTDLFTSTTQKDWKLGQIQKNMKTLSDMRAKLKTGPTDATPTETASCKAASNTSEGGGAEGASPVLGWMTMTKRFRIYLFTKSFGEQARSADVQGSMPRKKLCKNDSQLFEHTALTIADPWRALITESTDIPSPASSNFGEDVSVMSGLAASDKNCC